MEEINDFSYFFVIQKYFPWEFYMYMHIIIMIYINNDIFNKLRLVLCN